MGNFKFTRANSTRCAHCKALNIECKYQAPRPTKKDQSMTVAINAIRRLEAKIEELTSAITASSLTSIPDTEEPDHTRQSVTHNGRSVTSTFSNSHPPPLSALDHRSPVSTFSHASPGVIAQHPAHYNIRGSVHESGPSPQTIGTPGQSPYPLTDAQGRVNLSFSQHGVALWPAVKQILPPEFITAREQLPREYIVETENQRPPLSITIESAYRPMGDQWLTSLPLSVIKGLSDAYFSIFHRNTPVLDKFHFFSNTLGIAMENDFGYDIETCLVLNVLALGCLAVKAHEEGNFPLPSRQGVNNSQFVRPEWYDLVLDDPAGLKFFNEARRRFGFLMCQNDLQSAQFYMLSTMFYAQILRPIDSWTTVNRASLCCISILKRTESINFDEWEGDMFSRVFWSTLMYETIIIQELDLPLSGLLEYEADMPIPKFTPCPRPKTSISGLLVDEDDSFFNFHFLAQAAHRILLTRIRHSLYSFVEREGSPTPAITAEMHHQIEQWRLNLPHTLQFSDSDPASMAEETDNLPTPAHVFAKAMLRSRYLVAKFHIGRPFLYKALHAPGSMTDTEYGEIREGLKAGMYWPTTMGLCTQMMSALPLKFGWCSQCFGQVLLFHTVARSPDPKLRETLPASWEDWVKVMMQLIEACGKESPGIAKDAELLRLL